MADTKIYYVYILASKPRGTSYTGFTENVCVRTHQHKTDQIKGFTQKYNVHHLVYFEQHGTPESGIKREKQIKKWNRQWKINLIERQNPYWEDLYSNICSGGG